MHETMAQPVQSSFEDQEQELVVELTKLQRQYRIMENDRKAYRADTLNLIKKQTKQIEELSKEKTELQMYLNLARSDQYISKDVANFLALQELLKSMNMYRIEIDSEKEKLSAIDNEYTLVQTEMNEEWKKVGGKQAGQDLKLHLVKRIRRMENNLDNSMKEFNNAIAENNLRKTTIQHMLHVREHFNDLYQKLLKHLEITKNEMNETVAQASQAFDQREECQTKIQALKDRWEKDDLQYQLELKELHRGLEHDQILKIFMQKKTRDRDLILDMPPSRKVLDSEKKGNRDKITNIEFYRNAFKKIASLTGEESIDVLVEQIKKTEESNFALFNYVNDLNGEIEDLIDVIAKLNEQIREVQVHEKQREANRQESVRKLEINLEGQVKLLDETQGKLQRSRKSYEYLEAGIGLLFQKSGSRQYLSADIMGEDGINNKNVTMYLGAIEQRAMFLLSVHAYLKAKMEREGSRTVRGSPHVTSTVPPVPPLAPSVVVHNIQAPPISFEESSLVVDGTQTALRPMTASELKEVLQKEKSTKQSKTFSLKQTGPKHKEKKHGR